MGIKIDNLKKEIHDKMNFYRRILEILKDQRFEDGYKVASNLKRELVCEAVRYSDENFLRTFLAMHKPIVDCNMAELKLLAYEYDIKIGNCSANEIKEKLHARTVGSK